MYISGSPCLCVWFLRTVCAHTPTHTPPQPLAAEFAERFTELSQGKQVAVMGTVYKEMPLKPSVLDQISTEVVWYLFLFSLAQMTVII